MASRSYANLLDLASGGDLLDIPHTPRTLPRVMTVPRIISDLDGESDVSSSGCREQKIIVANMLPLQAKRDIGTAKWCFSWDEDSILLQLKDGFSSDTEVIYMGSLKAEIDASEQDEVAQRLLDDFNCVPTFLPHDLYKKFYLGFFVIGEIEVAGLNVVSVSFEVEEESGKTFEVGGREFLVNDPSDIEGFLESVLDKIRI